jgi:hypothetical protein
MGRLMPCRREAGEVEEGREGGTVGFEVGLAEKAGRGAKGMTKVEQHRSNASSARCIVAGRMTAGQGLHDEKKKNRLSFILAFYRIIS